MTNPPRNAALTTRTTTVLYLDVALLLAFIALLSPRLTGLGWHEVLGLLFTLPLLLHLLTARRWVAGVIKRLLGAADPRARVNLAINVTLFILIVIELFSGIQISQIALPYFGLKTINDQTWRLLHNLALNWTLLLVGLHVSMNWSWILTAIRRRPASHTPGRVEVATTIGAALRWTALVLAASAIIATASVLILGKPTEARLHLGDEVARFSPNILRGAVQFLGESSLVAIVAYFGRRWLRLRL